jgi:AcrR family transcriptional regulator
VTGVPERADRRPAIVAAALAVIGETGLGGFTQPRVAARAGMRQSHLTYYFPTRDDLLVAVAQEAVRRRVALLAEALTGADGLDAQLAALAGVLASPEQTRVLLALTQAADQNAAVRAAFGTLAADLGPLGVRVLTAAGLEADPAVAALLQATSTGIAVLALARGDDVTDLAERLLRTFVDRLGRTTPS